MSKKSFGRRGDDVLVGGMGNDRFYGGRGNDKLIGNAGDDRLDGGKGNDLLDGGTGRDRLEGGKGDDRLLGGAGNDKLEGDHGNDVVDGGAGSDWVDAGSGNDRAVYAMAENLGARDHYDGGSGYDILELRLTHGEFLLASVQKDIADFNAFLGRHGHRHGDCDEFEFKSFKLEVEDFEKLVVTLVNTGPTAVGDAGAIDEDHVLLGSGLLANDTDPDHLDALKVVGSDATSARGALVSVNANGTYSYDPRAVLALQGLQVGESLTDTFHYTIADLAGARSTATVTITVGGVNDAPDAVNDTRSMNEDTVATINVLANDVDVDGDGLSVVAVSAAANGSVAINADNTLKYTPNANFFGTDSFTYTVDDGNGGTDTAKVNVTVANVSEVGKGKVADEVPPGTDLQYFMRVEGVTNDWVELHSFSLGMSQSGTSGGGGGGGAGKTNVSDVSVALGTAPSAADLFEIGQVGKHLEFVEIEAYAPGGKEGGRLVDEFKFEDVLVSSHQVSGAGSSGVQESLSFNFTKFGHTHVEQKADGSAGAETGMTFDVQANKVEGTGPDANPDAIKGEQEAVGGGNMEYFLKVDGIGDWLSLGSFSLGLSNPTSGGGGGGGGAGKVVFQDLAVTLGSSSELVELTEMLAKGQHIKSLELEAYRLGGKEGSQIIDEFKFEDVLVSSWSTSGASNSLSFDYATVDYGHQLYKADGSTGGFTGTIDPAANALKAPQADDVTGPLEYFMRVEGVTNDWVELHSFSLGMSQSGTSGGGGGGGAGKTNVSDVSVALGTAPSAADLFEIGQVGKHLEFVEIEAYAPGGKEGGRLVDEFKFEDVLVSSHQVSGAGSSGVQESLSFNFTKFGHTHVEQKADGSAGAETGMTFDVQANKVEGTGPDANPDAIKGEQEAVGGGNMEYFLKVDGIGDWLSLGSFSLGLSNPTSGGGGGGGGAGKVVFQDLAVTLGSSSELVELTEMLAKGQHIKSLELEAYRLGGKEGSQIIDEFKFEDVLVSSWSTSGASNSLSFDYATVDYGHQLYKADGSTGGFTGTIDPAANALKAPQADDVTGPLEYFMRVEGVTNDWVELHSFSLGMSQSGTSGGGGGGGAGKTNVSDVSVALGTAPSAADLFEIGQVGKHLEFVEIEAYAPGGKEGGRLVDEFKFEDVLVSSHQVSGAFGAPDQHAVSFNFTKFGHTHVEQKADGSAGAETGMTFDVQANKVEGTGPDANPDAIKGEQEAVVNADMELFLKVDGIGDWLSLGSFSLGLSNPTSGGGGGGGGAGKVTLQDLSVTLGSSSELVELTEMLAKGQHIKSLELEAYRVAGKEGLQIIDEFKFEDVLVTQWDTFNATSNTLVFDYAEVSYGHQLYKADGSAGGFTGEHDPNGDIVFF